MVRSLSERLRAHEQQKARLAQQLAKLKIEERNAHTRRLIEAGGLVEKAGLLHLDAKALQGALLSLRGALDNKSEVERWTMLACEMPKPDQGKEALVLTFAAALNREAATDVRAAGFRFNKVLQHWEGLARRDEAEKLARANGGTLRGIAVSEQQIAAD
ncbi:MAG: conjugal transfer protein TraD [Alphaproteobacteria bacterium]|nr:conjugal transfer protein TraD [Alphaproteobacteria bacterium]